MILRSKTPVYLVIFALLGTLHAAVVMYGTTVTGTSTDPIPNAGTLECLACHDGNLGDDHPTSIAYTIGSASLKPLDTPLSNWEGATVISDVLYNGKVECLSCHYMHPDPLINANGSLFLRDKSGNGVCMCCHNE